MFFDTNLLNIKFKNESIRIMNFSLIFAIIALSAPKTSSHSWLSRNGWGEKRFIDGTNILHKLSNGTVISPSLAVRSLRSITGVFECLGVVGVMGVEVTGVRDLTVIGVVAWIVTVGDIARDLAMIEEEAADSSVLSLGSGKLYSDNYNKLLLSLIIAINVIINTNKQFDFNFLPYSEINEAARFLVSKRLWCWTWYIVLIKNDRMIENNKYIY